MRSFYAPDCFAPEVPAGSVRLRPYRTERDEDSDGDLNAYEFKWNPKAKSRGRLAFRNAYPDSTFEIVHKDNFNACHYETQ